MTNKRKSAKPLESAKRAPTPRTKKSRDLNMSESSCDFVKVTRAGLHSRNKHQGRYDFAKLTQALPSLAPFVIKNPKGEASISFSDSTAVKMLNKALLSAYYQVADWDIPAGYLCPPIPGRADYIHRLAELLEGEVKGEFPHEKVQALDIGVGANAIYPIIAICDYHWSYTGSDVDSKSIESARRIADSNPVLQGQLELKLQDQSQHIFQGIIGPTDYFHVTTCNPPFHASAQEAAFGTQRKLDNLAANRLKKGVTAKAGSQKISKNKPILNFGGQNSELWCQGGESSFLKRMANESERFAHQVLWFSTLVSKKDNVRPLRKQLEKLGVRSIRVVEMSQGQKVSRFVAWSFMDKQQRGEWIKLRG
ncbi:23S rRNA (adenine(1618)-N(6))-methyltransferase RlmF [Vibrio vulnificus]|uniref:23S rRNA (adenine(1618)-N(6))-methyltransferase RlmF n=1 Tax=Vibrio vulnificus TaxID=672 RepID=UPI001029B1E1|nr:23S rRNA (adenine(1618)-N(6))-methyltransferase RlmF [Vibrio vulnificus]EGQ7991354.1 23S rRNA (adenine(1618)-N(6))-methyltransferase RlmF [Vibrio vulnificus]EGQ7996870.1 23S rRNA (adenine(1618)-N(6))-methyltransferase RlmF [Vibrio vulnificus]EGR0129069.1 23S rRNA (adenine(1618)-N(6))-methyltransferase RlmF [Vibrio vulnificus]EIJ0968493.1 23S rRNA (adenine(1618)-N(6))-methyltransferase RlmF [Vibrio vulnificus]EIO4058252.1 23S rRNA (adenine(1618)-N(6))-methyltransferase RlmF [Vibrio vulnificu